jgi:hypothetical protein
VQYGACADSELYTFEIVSYLGSKKETRASDMLLIGQYYQKRGGSPLWTYTDGLHVQYYRGNSNEVCKRVSEGQKSRMYFSEHFCLMGLTKGSTKTKQDNDQALKSENEVLETVVHFAFLLTGRITVVRTPRGTDMLQNLKLACMTFEEKCKAEEVANDPASEEEEEKQQQLEMSTRSGAVLRNVSQHVAREASVALSMPDQRTIADFDGTPPRIEPSCKSLHTPTVSPL